MKPCFVNGGIDASGNNIDSGQPAQCTQADQSRNFLFFVNFMHVKWAGEARVPAGCFTKWIYGPQLC